MADKEFENQVVWLPELTREKARDVLDGYSFKGCVLRGPAVLLLLKGVTMIKCRFEHPDSVFAVDKERSYYGMIGVTNSQFINTSFERVGFAGNQDLVNSILSDAMGE